MSPAAKKSTDSAASAARKPAKKTAEPGPEPTHEVLREFSLDSAQLAIGDLVYLDGLNASELESHGYVRRH